MCRNFKPRLRAASKRAFEQRRADAMALPRTSRSRTQLPPRAKAAGRSAEFGRAAQDAVDEKAVDDGVHAKGEIGVSPYEIVRDRAGEPVAPAHRIEPEQMVAIVFGLADPELPDQAAMGQNVVHRASRFHGRRFFAKHWQAVEPAFMSSFCIAICNQGGIAMTGSLV